MDKTKNTLGDLNNMLFAMAEEIMEMDEMSDKEAQKTLKKAKSLTAISSNIIKNASLVYKASVLKEKTERQSNGRHTAEIPRLLTGNPNDKNYLGD